MKIKRRFNRYLVLLAMVTSVVLLSQASDIGTTNDYGHNYSEGENIGESSFKYSFYADSPDHKDREKSKSWSIVEDRAREKESKEAFLAAYKVFMHPRCMNCHPIGDIPLQGDDSHLHTQGVKRGVDGKGVYTNKCSNCHQSQHIPGRHMPPGSPTWHLPSSFRKMVFQGKSPRQLAAGFKDSTFTGFKSVERIIEHVENDPLVNNSFTYGTRPPLSHKEFVAKVREWIEKGAVLPDK